MLRILVVILAVFGMNYLAMRLCPSCAQVAFTLGGWAITYLFMACCAAGFIAYKLTK